MDRLVAFANSRLGEKVQRYVDGEDIAVMAFSNFFEKTPTDFEKLVNRNDLWQVLSSLAARRAVDCIRRESSKKRGFGETLIDYPLDQAAAIEKPVDYDVLLAEEVESCISALPTDVLKQAAVLRMEGLENREIAKHLKLSLRSVERKFEEIRDILKSCSSRS